MGRLPRPRDQGGAGGGDVGPLVTPATGQQPGLGVVGARRGQGGQAAPGPAPAAEHLHLGRGVAAGDPAAHQDRCSQLSVTCHVLHCKHHPGCHLLRHCRTGRH